ncbi:hypothetical protein JMUB7533_26870 [Staphylococcus aureus]
MSRGLGDVYKRQMKYLRVYLMLCKMHSKKICLLYTSDAADEARSVDLGGRRIIKKAPYH